MPILFLSGVLPTTPQTSLEQLIKALQTGTAQSLGDISEGDVTVFFPQDLCLAGLGEEIIISVEGLYEKPERSDEVLRKLATAVARVVHLWFPLSKIECFVTTQKPSHTCVIEASKPVGVA